MLEIFKTVIQFFTNPLVILALIMGFGRRIARR